MSEIRPAVERRHPPAALMHLINPVVRRLISSGRGRAGDQLILLHYTGRKSGRRFDIPVGYQLIAGTPTVFTNSRWRHNFSGGRDIEMTLRGRRRAARATLVDDPTIVAQVYYDLISELGVKAAQRRMGIRVNLDRNPTLEELDEAVRRYGLSLVRLEET